MQDYIKNSMPLNEDEDRIKHELILEATLLNHAKYDLWVASIFLKNVDKLYKIHGDSIFDIDNHEILVEMIKEAALK